MSNSISPPPPLQTPAAEEAARDAEHIRLLSIFHYVMAGLIALGASMPVLHLAMGMMMVDGQFFGTAVDPAERDEVAMMGWIFVAFSATIILLGWCVAVVVFLAGRWLSQRRNRTFVFVVACVLCLIMPMGTVLGVFTILVLQRPRVMALFDGPEAGQLKT